MIHYGEVRADAEWVAPWIGSRGAADAGGWIAAENPAAEAVMKERRANDMTFIVSQAMRSLFHPPLNLYR